MFSYLGKAGDTRSALYRPHVAGKLTAVSFVTVGELMFGAHKANWPKAKIDRLKGRLKSIVIVPYDLSVCETYARIKVSLGRGRTIADNDLWIAACAMRHSIPLVTHNRKHFEEIKGLVVISEQQVDHELKSQTKLDISPAASDEKES